MKNRFSTIIILCLLSVSILPAQTVIKIPFVQPPPFVVHPKAIYKSMENHGQLELGLDTEIHGGSGKYTFIWTLNGNSVGTDPTLFITQKGSYTLSVNDGEGCEAISVYHVDTGVGIIESAENQVQIFPNPSDGNFFILTPIAHKLKKLEVFSIDGMLRFSQTDGLKSDEIRIDAGHLPVGSYLVVLQFESEKITKVLVIR